MLSVFDLPRPFQHSSPPPPMPSTALYLFDVVNKRIEVVTNSAQNTFIHPLGLNFILGRTLIARNTFNKKFIVTHSCWQKKIIVGGTQTMIFKEIFSLKSFPLYSTCTCTFQMTSSSHHTCTSIHVI